MGVITSTIAVLGTKIKGRRISSSKPRPTSQPHQQSISRHSITTTLATSNTKGAAALAPQFSDTKTIFNYHNASTPRPIPSQSQPVSTSAIDAGTTTLPSRERSIIPDAVEVSAHSEVAASRLIRYRGPCGSEGARSCVLRNPESPSAGRALGGDEGQEGGVREGVREAGEERAGEVGAESEVQGIPVRDQGKTDGLVSGDERQKKREEEEEEDMATDQEYMDFLHRANEEGAAASECRGGEKVVLRGVDGEVEEVVPEAVRAVVKGGSEEVWYESEADEVFEGVSLGVGAEGASLPDGVAFAKLAGHPAPEQADVTILDTDEWDPKGRYGRVVDAVRAAVGPAAGVRVYRVGLGGARVEYWVVGLVGERLVGAKVLAIES